MEEFIAEGETGLLAGFADVDVITSKVVSVLRDPPPFLPLGDVASRLIRSRDSLSISYLRLAGPYSTRPGRAAVIRPFSNATCPFTMTTWTPSA